MKKIIVRLFLVLGLLVIAAVVGVTLFLDSIIQKGVVTVGPKITQTEVKLDGVKLSLLSGAGELRGFVLANPTGYKSPSAMSAGRVKLALAPKSLMADKIVIRTIQVEAPEITLEGGPKDNNLTKILENVQAATGGAGKEPTAKPAPEKEGKGAQTKVQVDEFRLSGAKLKYAVPGLGGKTIDLVLPTIEMKNLGQGPEGITTAELTRLVLSSVLEGSVKAIGDSATKIGGDALKGIQDSAGQGLQSVTNKAAEGLKGLLKPK